MSLPDSGASQNSHHTLRGQRRALHRPLLRLLVRRVQGPGAAQNISSGPRLAALIGQAITKFCLTGRPGSELDVVGQAITKFCKWWYS